MSFRLSPAARADLRSIWLYTNETWGRSQADNYVFSIEMLCVDLARGTIRGRSAEQYRVGYLSAPIGSHFVFYKMRKSGGIDVIRILHQRMNIPSRLADKHH